jgi:hypothetical protein
MALQTDFFSIGLKDAKAKIGAVLYDIPGIKKLSFDPEMWTARADGDNIAMMVTTGLTGFGKITCENAIFSQATLAALMGTTVGTSGTTPNQVETLDLKGNTVFPEFILEGSSSFIQSWGSGTVPADTHMKAYHCRISKLPQFVMGMPKDGYNVYNLELEVWADQTTEKIVTFTSNETAAAIV